MFPIKQFNFLIEPLQSPGPSAVDRFQSPIANPPNSEIRKQLFKPSQPTKHLSKYCLQ